MIIIQLLSNFKAMSLVAKIFRQQTTLKLSNHLPLIDLIQLRFVKNIVLFQFFPHQTITPSLVAKKATPPHQGTKLFPALRNWWYHVYSCNSRKYEKGVILGISPPKASSRTMAVPPLHPLGPSYSHPKHRTDIHTPRTNYMFVF